MPPYVTFHLDLNFLPKYMFTSIQNEKGSPFWFKREATLTRCEYTRVNGGGPMNDFQFLLKNECYLICSRLQGRCSGTVGLTEVLLIPKSNCKTICLICREKRF